MQENQKEQAANAAPEGKKWVVHKAVLPIYSVGFVWLLYALFFPLYSVSGFLIAGVLSLIVYFVLSKLCKDEKELVDIPEETVKTGDEIADKLIADGKEYLKKIREINAEIDQPEVTAHVDKIVGISQKIIAFLSENPKKSSQVRQFLNYYLPTVVKLLDNYNQMEDQGIEGENITATKKKIEDTLAVVDEAFEKQLDALFSDAALDISTDITVLETMMAREGLAQDGMGQSSIELK